MNRTSTIIVIIIAVILVGVAFFHGKKAESPAVLDTGSQASSTETLISDRVMEFATKLKDVSLLAPRDMLTSQIASEYGPYLTPELLQSWEDDPTLAPGRAVSSPWPDHIQITSIVPEDEGEYTVTGEIAEVTSADTASSGPSAIYPVTLTVVNENGAWLISRVEKGAYAQ